MRINARHLSQGQLCKCIAPGPEAFGQHFLEIGASDGQFLSNSLFFEAQMGWTGLCVEGSPTLFKTLRASRRKCTNVNSIISKVASPARFLTIDAPERWQVGLSCMENAAGCTQRGARSMARKLNATVVAETVQGSTLQGLFEKLGFKHFGFMSIDVEGAEDMVIETIDFAKTPTDLVFFEQNVGDNHARAANHILAAGMPERLRTELDRWFLSAEPRLRWRFANLTARW